MQSTFASSSKISWMDLPSKEFDLLSELKCTQSTRMCLTVKSAWQWLQWGTLLSSPLAIRCLWVRWVCPILNLVKMMLILLSGWQEDCQGFTDGGVWLDNPPIIAMWDCDILGVTNPNCFLGCSISLFVPINAHMSRYPTKTHPYTSSSVQEH